MSATRGRQAQAAGEGAVSRAGRAPVAPDDDLLVTAARWEEEGWPAGPRLLAATSILRAKELIRRSNDVALRPYRLTHARHEALVLLHFAPEGELPLGRLSRRLLVHPTSITSTVDTLERLRLAVRVPHPTDRRATLASITPAGRTAIETSCRRMASDRFGLQALTGNQAEKLYRTLLKVRAAAGDLQPSHNSHGGHHDPVLAAAANWHQHGWDGGPAFLAALSILRTAELIQHANDRALRPHGLTHARYEALAPLYFAPDGELTLGALSDQLLVHPTSVTSTVDTFERLGVAERVPHPEDRRATLARITPAGCSAIERSSLAMAAGDFGVGALSEAQAKGVYEVLKKVRAAGAHRGTGTPAPGASNPR